jgi:alanyl-tRNA synthetase
MENNRSLDGTLTPLANKNIDTGMGLERMAQILQRVPNNYETDLILPIVQRAAQVRKRRGAAGLAAVLTTGCRSTAAGQHRLRHRRRGDQDAAQGHR